jgi:predicted nucleic acid-binding protein
MEIIYPQNLIASLEHKHLLLDANVFRDAAGRTSFFANFFNKLKQSNVTLATLDAVIYELLKGAQSEEKYKAREKQIHDIIDIILPLPQKSDVLAYNLIKEYGIDGTSLSVTDLYLGTMLSQYKQNIFLMTRDTTDFIQSIFDLKFIINAPHNKGIFTYGIYQYSK